jgi:cold shock CspA family protein
MTSNKSKLTFSTLGCVKWFNNRSGYGFIVAIGDQSHYGDVFVHHSQLRISDPNIYKSLMTGEYVEFEITPTSDGKHKYQANNVTGIFGGKLLCESNPVIRHNPTPQQKYKILQRDSSNTPTPPVTSAAPAPVPVPNPPTPQQEAPPATAPSIALPKSKKPRNSPPPQPTVASSPVAERPNKKRTTPKKG